MSIIARMAEEKIKRAINNGELDNLTGKGKPLYLEKNSAIPEELRTSYKILKNAGVLPEELEVKKEIVTLQNLLDCCYDDKEKLNLKKKLNENMLRYNILMERRGKSKDLSVKKYENKIFDKFVK